MNTTSSPQYLKIKHYIVEKIQQREWLPLTKIPSENEFVQQFSVSRMTVNRALRELTDAGILSRSQGLGTFVAGAKAESTPFEVKSIRDEIQARGQQHTVRMISCKSEPANIIIAAHFEVAKGYEIFHSKILHCANKQPLLLENRFVNPLLAPDYLGLDFQTITPHDYLMQVAPLERAEHSIDAEIATRPMAKLLMINESDAVLVLTRRTWSAQKVVSYATLTYPAARYRFTGSVNIQRRF